MQEQMDSVSRKMEGLRINQKEMLEIKNTLIKMKNAMKSSFVNWTQLKKEPLSLRMSQ